MCGVCLVEGLTLQQNLPIVLNVKFMSMLSAGTKFFLKIHKNTCMGKSLNVKKLSRRQLIIILNFICHNNFFQSFFKSSCWLCCYVEDHSHSQHGSSAVLYTGNEQPVTEA